MPENTEKMVFFDLKDNSYDRYLALFFLFFELAGYTVVVKFRPGFVGRWATSLIFQDCKRFCFAWKAPAQPHMSITNDPRRQHQFDFLLTHNYFGNGMQGHFVPMPMVDSFYAQNIFRFAEKLQNSVQRPMGVFFAGRFREKEYSRPEVPKYFHCFTRIELLTLIRKNFQPFMKNVDDAAELPLVAEHNVIIVDRDKTNVNPGHLYEVLSCSNFFLAFPGVVMPLCHNIIEAMAFGCIPILQYPDLFHPPLRNRMECLAFKDEESLRRSVLEALNMNAEDIETMRVHVVNYYNQYLTPSAVVGNILEKRGDEKQLVLNAEYESVRFLMKEDMTITHY